MWSLWIFSPFDTAFDFCFIYCGLLRVLYLGERDMWWPGNVAPLPPRTQLGQLVPVHGREYISVTLIRFISLHSMAQLIYSSWILELIPDHNFSFVFFCSVQRNSILSTTLFIILKKGYFPPSKRRPSRTAPPHFCYRSHTPCAWRCVSGAQGEH